MGFGGVLVGVMLFLNNKARVILIGLILGLLMGGCAEEPEIAEESELERTKRWSSEGDAWSQFNLGVMYSDGEGVPQDYKEAIKWYKMAAEQGNTDAQYNLGFMCYNGEGVPQDYKEAIKWYRMAADQGDADAQNFIGAMHFYGEGIPQDYKYAYVWFSIAKANGHEKAKDNLNSVSKNMTKEQISEAMSLSTEIYNRIETNKKD